MEAASASSIGPQLIEVCKRSPNELAKIRQLVKSCPDAVRYRDHEDRTALHVLCANRPPLPSVQFLLQAQGQGQQACSLRTNKGMLPLHYACREQASAEVVELLLSQYPEGARVPTASGWWPLHLSCARGGTPSVLELLIQAWPDSVRQTTNDGRLALHFACANQATLQVIQLLVKSYRHAIPVQDQNEWTPLHIACAYTESLEIIQFLVEEWPDGLTCPGKMGRLPLHVACWEGQEKHIVEYLVQKCKPSIQIRDSDGLLPLHCACQGESGLLVIQYLISQSPATALELGQTPQEVAMYALNHGVIQDAPKPPDAFVEWLKRHVPTLASAPAGSATPPLALSSSFGGGDGGAGRLSPKPNVFVPPQGRSAINRVPVMELPPPVFAPAVSSTLDAKHSLQPSDFAQFAAANSASNSFDHYQPQSSYATMMVPESYPRSHNHYSADFSSRYSRSALPEMFHIAIPEQRLLSLQLNRKICLSTRKFRPTLL